MEDARNMTPQEILRKYYGYRSFRTHQLDIIESVMRGQDAFVLMPTGSGKSISRSRRSCGRASGWSSRP